MIKDYLKVGIQEPSSVLRYIVKGKESVTRYKVAQLLNVSEFEVKKYDLEIKKNIEFQDKIQSTLADYNVGQISGPEVLYVICRILKPKVVVETGVASGVSTVYILKALDKNDSGTLFSIDMPNHDRELAKKGEKKYTDAKTLALIPPDKETGYVVPPKLKKRWSLHLGLTKKLLPRILNEIDMMDIFLHDSEHTYENMGFEYRLSWPRIRKGGVLLSHDVNWSTAFDEFYCEVKRKPYYIHFVDIAGVRK